MPVSVSIGNAYILCKNDKTVALKVESLENDLHSILYGNINLSGFDLSGSCAHPLVRSSRSH